jgi:uncharacterized damage-inducible protein DinB
MTAEEMRRLFAYNSWANGKTLGALAEMPPAGYNTNMKSSHGGIHGTMLHIVWAQHLWLLRWTGRPNDAASAGLQKAVSLESLRAYSQEVDRETLAFLDARLTDAFLRETFEMKTTKGDSYTHTYGEAMLHLINHSTYHRGQVAALVRQSGYRPPSTDFIRFAREFPASGKVS